MTEKTGPSERAAPPAAAAPAVSASVIQKRNSSAVLKGHLTRKCDEVVQVVGNISDEMCTPYMLQEIRDLRKTLSVRWEKVEDCLEQLVILDPGESNTRYFPALKEEQDKYKTHVDILMQAENNIIVALARMSSPSVSAPPAAPAAPAPAARQSKANLALKPSFDLDVTHSTMELRMWLRMFLSLIHI